MPVNVVDDDDIMRPTLSWQLLAAREPQLATLREQRQAHSSPFALARERWEARQAELYGCRYEGGICVTHANTGPHVVQKSKSKGGGGSMNDDNVALREESQVVKQIQLSRLSNIMAHLGVWKWAKGEATAEQAINEVQKALDFLDAQDQSNPFISPATEDTRELLKGMRHAITLPPEDQAVFLKKHSANKIRLPWKNDGAEVIDISARRKA